MQGYIEGSFDWNGLGNTQCAFCDLAGGPKVATNVNVNLVFEASTIDWLSQLLHLEAALPEGLYVAANFDGPSSVWNYSLNVPHLRYNGIEAFSINGEGTKERRGIQALLKAGTIDGISIPLDSAELRWDLPTDVQQFTALAHVKIVFRRVYWLRHNIKGHFHTEHVGTSNGCPPNIFGRGFTGLLE